jgi:hypothetical protein
VAAPDFLMQATQGWAKTYGSSHVVSNGVVFLHFAGLLLAGGSAIAADRATLVAARQDAAARAAYLRHLGSVHGMVIGGLAIMFVSGALMFLADVETFWGLRVFWGKMVLIAVLLANGFLMKQAGEMAAALPSRAWTQLKVTSVVSLVLWFAVVLASTVMAGS